MCGICGIVLSDRSDRTIDRAALVRARDTLTHRGPDDAGLYLDERAGLGHRRLSIVDIEGGHQPMSSDDGALHLVYNGEVYNHRALRAGLQDEGHRYRTRCDTETVLRLYESRGLEAISALRGMFAFALWDARRKRLVLARDRVGIKPLYYALLEDGSLCFGSEIKAILALWGRRPSLHAAALPDYLANHAPSGPDTLYEGVRRLLPGHTLVWRDGTVTVERYWDPRFPPAAEPRTPPSDPGGEFRERLTESVRLRLMADVPLGVFLSGGIDSAAITGVMAGLVDEPIRSFSVAFAERSASELGYAREVAEAFGTEHHEVVVTPDEFFDALPRLIWHEDEPIAHPSSVPLYFVAELAARHVKVVLTGEGSDELLGGYGRYWRTLWNQRWGTRYRRLAPAPLRAVARAAVRALPVTSRVRTLAERTFLFVRPELASVYLDNFAVFSRGRQRHLLAPDLREAHPGVEPYAHESEILARTEGLSTLNRLLDLDLRTYLHELLMKQDQMSMAASIESRVPFLDHELIEWVVGLPDEWKLSGRTTKRVLREAMRGVLPDSILTRPKMGFPVPFGLWARGPWHDRVREVIAGDRARARGLFDPAYVERLLSEHRAGVDHAERLWSLFNLELWQRGILDGGAASGGDTTAARLARAVP
ncbi:MAG: asparagine synthase (glutamine-hydrolyzing) [Gemmatimonadota bacterium]|nr:asparagine synthase (glutamine-hydrolyzing) [Gemmatimonadota bacterium]